jgi:hypothetical protein
MTRKAWPPRSESMPETGGIQDQWVTNLGRVRGVALEWSVAPRVLNMNCIAQTLPT